MNESTFLLKTNKQKSSFSSSITTNANNNGTTADGDDIQTSRLCFIILASDGLWDTVSNQEAIDMVETVVNELSAGTNHSHDSSNHSAFGYSHWYETAALQQAAEALTHEAYIRGSTDNIGVCIVAIS